MDQTEFRALCRAASLELACRDVDQLGNTNIIEINGIRIGLFFDEDMAPDRLHCYLDIGKLPTINREEILERILALNLLTATKTAGVYGLDQQTDSLIFIQHLLFPELMTGEILANILQGYSAHSTSLKENLLDPSNLMPVPEMLERSFDKRAHSLA